MRIEPEVTVICATRNVRDVVLLMLASFNRHTPESVYFMVADNESTDGILEEMRKLPWLTVFSLEERRRLIRREQLQQLLTRLHSFEIDLSPREQFLLGALRDSAFAATLELDANITEHGCTLDWLIANVRTPFFLTLDSDVEFLEAGWLSEMLGTMVAKDLTALGDYEQGFGNNYLPRLSPHLLLVRTADFRALEASFRGVTFATDPAEVTRLRKQPTTFHMHSDELANYRTAQFFSTGALFFKRMLESGARWDVLSESVRRKVMHLGHMSWPAEMATGRDGIDWVYKHKAGRLDYARHKLLTYY